MTYKSPRPDVERYLEGATDERLASRYRIGLTNARDHAERVGIEAGTGVTGITRRMAEKITDLRRQRSELQEDLRKARTADAPGLRDVASYRAILEEVREEAESVGITATTSVIGYVRRMAALLRAREGEIKWTEGFYEHLVEDRDRTIERLEEEIEGLRAEIENLIEENYEVLDRLDRHREAVELVRSMAHTDHLSIDPCVRYDASTEGYLRASKDYADGYDAAVGDALMLISLALDTGEETPDE